MLGALLAGLLQASGAAAPPPDAQRPVVAPDWVRKPTGEDVARYFPEAAMRSQTSGRATISCRVVAAGTLADCAVVEESPPGMGFGESALRMSTLFKMRPQTKDGQPVDGGVVRIPLRFVLGGGAADPLTGMLACYGATAAAFEADPSDPEAANAFATFAGQVALQEVRARSSPDNYEKALALARFSAVARRAQPEEKAVLKACLSLVKKPNL